MKKHYGIPHMSMSDYNNYHSLPGKMQRLKGRLIVAVDEIFSGQAKNSEDSLFPILKDELIDHMILSAWELIKEKKQYKDKCQLSGGDYE